MKPRYLVYILAAIIIAFVIRGYFCIDMIDTYLGAIDDQNISVKDGNLYHGVCNNVEGFKNHLMFSGVLAIVIAVCCRLKAPK